MAQPGARENIMIGSYWESSVDELPEDRQLFGEAYFDVAVIGGGITGLSAAMRLAEAGASVCVLEANRVGWGASGRNGGLCCLGGTKHSEHDLIKRFGLEEARKFVDFQVQAIDTVAERIATLEIDVDRHSRGEVLLAHRQKDADGFADEAAFLSDTFGLRTTVWSAGEIVERGLAGPEFHGGLHLGHGFALNPMKYVQGLARNTRRVGAKLFSHTPVLKLERDASYWRLETPHGSVRAHRVVLSGNGYSRENVPTWLRGRLLPVMSSVLVTRPLSRDELTDQGWTSDLMACDTRNLLHYFRLLPDGRFLFGTRGGIFETRESIERVRKTSRADFERMFPAWAHVDSEFAWHGHVCMARDLAPFVGRVPNMKGVYAAMAYHGSGVAMGSLSGEKVAELMLGKTRAENLPAVMNKPFRKFPLPWLRQLYLQGAYWWYGVKDR
ncbi:MAG: FAD-binding oxidoreductase [Rhodobacteraceae bacterium]|nr:FAD-binding oxidoreductase [Paracoccaceae bacterium]